MEAKDEIRLWALTKGSGHFRRTCPDCSSDRTKSNLEVLSVTIDHEKAVYKCWHCDLEGAVRLEQQVRYERPQRVDSKPKEKFKAIKEIGSELDASAKVFLKGRGISEDTAKMFGLTWARAYFLNIKRETHAIAMPYYVDGKVAGHKARSTEDKDHVCLPSLYSLFGIQNVDMTESENFIICEGEWDTLAMYEAGILNATSVPNGSQSFARTETTDDAKATYAFLWTAKAEIDKAKKILIATDMDEPGEKLAAEIARRIGKHRCWRVKFPDGCKDANDTLLKHGKEELSNCIETAEPWPIDGLYEATQFFPEVFDLYDHGFGDRILTGLTPVDALYSLGKGLLTVITGIPGNGKSTFVDQLMINAARKHGYICGICSFENPPSVHIAKLSEMLLQKHFFPTDDPGIKMTRNEMESTLPFITKHFKFFHQDDGKKATLESIIERIKTGVFRWGIQAAVIDPYNYIARPKNIDSETQWIDDMLTQLRLLAASHDIHLWFIAHPTKLAMDSDGHYPPPRGYSISGSNAWYAKADFGLTVHRTPNVPGEVRIINWKTRFDWLGKEGEAQIAYDNTRNVYIADCLEDLAPYGEEL